MISTSTLRTTKRLAITLIQVSTVWAAVASAQSASSNPRPIATLEDVVVTAQKREEDVERVPMSVTALSSDALELRGAKDFLDVARAVPGLGVVNAVPGQTTVTIRGVSASAGDATVTFYLDDVPLSSGASGNGGALNSTAMGAADPRVYDLSRVEVLRGPQGTLYGASSMGGAIRFITRQPQFDKFEGDAGADVSYSDRAATANYQGDFVVNLPVGDRAAFRVSGMYGSLAPDINRLSLSDPSSPPAVLTRRTNTDSYAVGRVIGLIKLTESLTIKPVFSFTDNSLDDLPFYASSLPQFTTYANFAEPQHDTLRLGALVVQQDLARSQIVSVSAYNERVLRQTADFGDGLYSALSAQFPPSLIPLLLPYRTQIQLPSQNVNTRSVLSEELRLQSAQNDSKLQWLLGAYFARNRWSNDQHIVGTGWDALGDRIFTPIFGGNPLSTGGQDDLFTGVAHYGSNEYAVFTHDTYKFSEQWSAAAGLRLFADHHVFDQTAGGFLNGNPGSRTVTPTLANSEHGTTPQASVSYQATTASLLYVSAAKGFRAGNANPPLPTNAACAGDLANYTAQTGRGVPSQFDPDTVWSYELGSKNALAGGRLIVNATVFYLRWNNIQTYFNLDDYAPPGGGGCGEQFTDNVGQAVSKGAELELEWRIGGGLTLGASGAYDRARITSHDATEGMAVLNVPELAGTVTATYTRQVAAGLSATLHWDTSYQGNSFRNFNPLTTNYEARHYAISGVRAGVTASRWEAALYATNLFNSRTPIDDYGSPISGAGAAAIPESQYSTETVLRGRTIGLSGKAHF